MSDREDEFRRQTLVSQLDERRPLLGYAMAGVGVFAAIVSGVILFRAPPAQEPVSSTTLASAPIGARERSDRESGIAPPRTASPLDTPALLPAPVATAEDPKPHRVTDDGRSRPPTLVAVTPPRSRAPRAASRTKTKPGADAPPPSTEVDIPLPEFPEPKPEATKPDAPKPEAPKAEAPKPPAPKPESPKDL